MARRALKALNRRLNRRGSRIGLAFLRTNKRNAFSRRDVRPQSRSFAAGIHARDAAPTPTGFAEIVSDCPLASARH
jgi:hypothetical protein